MEKSLKIYYTSDVHGYFYPTNYLNNDILDMGLLSLDKTIKNDKNTLLFDCGDMIQGSPFVQYLEKNNLGFDIVSDIMNELKYDAITLGNHDFNYGYDNLKSYINNFKGEVICTNVKDKLGELNIKPYSIFTMDNGIKVGVMGAVTTYVNVWETPKNIENIEINSIIDSIDMYYKDLKKNTDLLVLLYHGGLEEDINNIDETKENIAYLLSKKYEFDFLLTGHQHMNFEGRKINNSYITQNFPNANFIEEIDIDFRSSLSVKFNKLKINKEKLNTDLSNKYLDIQNSVNNWLDESIGKLTITEKSNFNEADPLTLMLNGSSSANLINKIILENVDADISTTSLMNKPHPLNEDINIRDIVALYPFSNLIHVIEVTKEEIKKALEVVLSFFTYNEGIITINSKYLSPKVELFNFDFYYGIDYKYDLSKDVGSRVTEIKINNEELEDKLYKLAVTSYRSTGTGGYDVFKGKTPIEVSKKEVQEMIIDHFIKK